ncbi:MAG: sugar ABC transporter substrate-binding protein [Lachnospiraceae bacterium]|nr:sugar ABC transporter substrate-binding protein [Lachnospiraceae bacterium]
MKKKSIALLLVTVMGISMLGGCGKAEQESKGKEVSTTESTVFNGELEKNVTIRVLENDTAVSKGYLDELIKAFNEKYADSGIVAVDANMDQYLDLANDGPYGYGPDVLYQANDVIMKYVDGKHIYPIPTEKLECYDKIPDAAWNAYKTKMGENEYVCGVPVNVQSGMLYYRKDLLPEDWKQKWDDNGNDVPDMVENWNDMYKFSQERHEKNSKQYGYMKSIYDAYFSSGFLFSYGGYVFGDNNTNPKDIGLSAGEAEKGAWVLSQLVENMTEECIDDTVTVNSYSKIADGTYFATITTPDLYTTFVDEMVLNYEKEGISEEEAKAKTKENLVMTTLPKLPQSGDLSEENPELIDTKAMGGINGYAISAYTKAPNACLAFVDFAAGYDMLMKRSEMLGVAPAREDVAQAVGGTSEMIYYNMEAGNIVLMPSVTEVGQIWTPEQTFFTDLAKDGFRKGSEKKYKDLAAMKAGLQAVDKEIYDAIFTLQ